jgi:hypothetical protein
MNPGLILLTLGAAGAFLLGGFALGMVAHYFWYAHDRSAGLGELIGTHRDTLAQIDDLMDYALGAHEHLVQEVDTAESSGERGP